MPIAELVEELLLTTAWRDAAVPIDELVEELLVTGPADTADAAIAEFEAFSARRLADVFLWLPSALYIRPGVGGCKGSST